MPFWSRVLSVRLELMNKLSSVYHGGAGVRTLKEGTGTQLSDHQQKPSIAVGVFLVPASKSIQSQSTRMWVQHFTCQGSNHLIKGIHPHREVQLPDRLDGMPCKSCGSTNQRMFTGKMGIHFPGLKNIDKPVVWVFPELVVCLDCGAAGIAVPEEELRQLAKGDAAAAG